MKESMCVVVWLMKMFNILAAPLANLIFPMYHKKKKKKFRFPSLYRGACAGYKTQRSSHNKVKKGWLESVFRKHMERSFPGEMSSIKTLTYCWFRGPSLLIQLSVSICLSACVKVVGRSPAVVQHPHISLSLM